MPTDAELRARHPELYAGDYAADPRTRTRTVPMQLLSMGMCRTGCASMQKALEILGYPCYHYFQNYAHPLNLPMWDEAIDAKYFGKGKPFTKTEWDQLLGHYAAITDVPAILFQEELMAVYPDAKVVLVERDEDKWLKSFSDTMVAPLRMRYQTWLVAQLDMGGVVARVRRNFWKVMEAWGADPYDPDSVTRDARRIYREHNANVRSRTPKDKLLEFKLEDGWEPLCAFLGKPVPDCPFPHLNETELLNEKVGLALKLGFVRGVKRIAVWSVPVAGAVLAWWAYGR